MQPSDQEILDPNRFIARIHTNAAFIARLPQTDLRGLSKEAHERSLHRAIAANALPSRQQSMPAREQSLDANLFKLASGLRNFYQNSQTLDSLRNRYGRPQNMPPRDKDRFYDSKEAIISFNDTLVEVINSGAPLFTFDELLTFMTDIFAATGDPHQVHDFHEYAREAIVGMRNEMAVEQILIAGGVEYRSGTVKEDSKGGDYFIDGVPIDFKSNEASAKRARMRAEEDGYDGSAILWSHVRFEDFDGKLMLPYDRAVAIFAELKPDLDAAIAAHKQSYVIRTN